jgi:hypothetical protein
MLIAIPVENPVDDKLMISAIILAEGSGSGVSKVNQICISMQNKQKYLIFQN